MEDIKSWRDKFEVCYYAKKLLDEIQYLNTMVKNPVDIEEIEKGIYYARKYHGSQMRQSGEPYYSHPIEVAIMAARFTAKEVPKLYKTYMINVSLLHDTMEDTSLTENMITLIFDKITANGVEGLTRIKPSGKISAEESLNLLFQQKRYDIGLIKLFDRIHNLQTLGVKSPEKATKIIKETIKSFLILAVYLGIQNIEQEIVKLCASVTNNSSSNSSHSFLTGVDDPVLPVLTFQNALTQKQILDLLALK